MTELPLPWGPSLPGQPGKKQQLCHQPLWQLPALQLGSAGGGAAPGTAPLSTTHLCQPRMHPLQMRPKSPTGPATAGLVLPRRHPRPGRLSGQQAPHSLHQARGQACLALGTTAGGQDPAREAEVEVLSSNRSPAGQKLPPRGNPAAARCHQLDARAGYGPWGEGAATRGVPCTPLPTSPSQAPSTQLFSLPPLPKGPLCPLSGAGDPPGLGGWAGGAQVQEGLSDPHTPSHRLSAYSSGNGKPSPHPRSESFSRLLLINHQHFLAADCSPPPSGPPLSPHPP